jgi:hypothetical protein
MTWAGPDRGSIIITVAAGTVVSTVISHRAWSLMNAGGVCFAECIAVKRMAGCMPDAAQRFRFLIIPFARLRPAAALF